MGLQISYSVCAKVSQERNIWAVESRDRSDIKRAVREKGSRDSRSNSMCGPHTHVGKDTSKNVCFQFRGIFERQKHADDIREARKFEISLWKQTFLVQRILCEYSGVEQREDRKVYRMRLAGISMSL